MLTCKHCLSLLKSRCCSPLSFTSGQLLLLYTFPCLLYLWALFLNDLVSLLILGLGLGLANWVVQLVLGKQLILDDHLPTTSFNTFEFYLQPFPISLFHLFEQDKIAQEYSPPVGEYRYILHSAQQLHNSPWLQYDANVICWASGEWQYLLALGLASTFVSHKPQ